MPPPSNSSASRSQDNFSMRPQDSVRDGYFSSNAQAQMLLTALRNIIVPLVQTAVPNVRDLDQVPLGSEAEDFLVALQQYISSIIQDRSQPDAAEARVVRTVDLEEARPPANSAMQAVAKLGQSVKRSSHAIRSGPPNYLSDHAEVVRLQNVRKVLEGLRAHVFNEMPIRLLAFTKHGSKLDITLLDRSGLYSLLASKLDEKSKAKSWSNWVWMESDANPHYKDIASYAILSHTWLHSAPGEVTYDNWPKGNFDLTQPGYRKLVNFCGVALEDHGLSLGWMDTICINKESSSELDESIRSMYKWYQKAKVCITYLADTTTLSRMPKDAWFTRGWTLQELLAPEYMKFYGSDWRKLIDNPSNDKTHPDIQQKIQSATTITFGELNTTSLDLISISRKMQWAAERKVTRGEDAAYSLMGIFNVNLSIAYGEGTQNAFVRLIKEILNTTAKTDILDVFNWAGAYRSHFSALIPSSPRAYLTRISGVLLPKFVAEPLTMTHLGLRVSILLLPAVPTSTWYSMYTPVGDYYATVNLKPIQSEPLKEDGFNVLDVKSFESDGPSFQVGNTRCRLAFAVLNSSGDEFHVDIPEHCFAIAILHNYISPAGPIITPQGYMRKVQTTCPIEFELETAQQNSSRSLSRTQLAKHGMQYLTMYL